MRHLAAALTSIAVSLWFGGLVTLALTVMAVFIASGLDRASAGQATSAMFVWFGKGQLVVAALALVGAFLGYLQGRRPTAMILFALLAVATVGAVVFMTVLVPRLEELRHAGQVDSADFKTMHKQSERLMAGVTLVLFAATVLLPAFHRALWPAKVQPSDPGIA